MTKLKRLCLAAAACSLLLALAGSARANNLAVTGVTVKPRDNSTALIQFDISWENSWRQIDINHDAAWVFFKVLAENRDWESWRHATLDGVGINPPGFSAGTGTPLDLIVPDDGTGVFVRRAQEGDGTLSASGVSVVWNFASNALVKTDRVRIRAYAVEMVYVAQGAFYAGSGGTEPHAFYAGASDNLPFLVDAAWSAPSASSPDARRTGNVTNQLWAGGTISAGTLHDAFPTGYKPFYCMKYEITQEQWADFLTALTPAQAATHYFATTSARHTISKDADIYTAAAPDRACGFLSWADSLAFAAWSGLRPMTELEYEKACRGPLPPVANEYAWAQSGDLTIEKQTGHIGTDGSGSETASPSSANCNFAKGISGPVRAGIYATTGSTRAEAGASYWGILDLSGNLWERCVYIDQRTFQATHGTGTLSETGAATNADWPTSMAISRVRGGSWNFDTTWARVSCRAHTTYGFSGRDQTYGFRAVRSAPADINP